MKKRKLVSVLGLIAAFAIVGAFAYFNQTMEVKNPFNTKKYSSELTESFKPEDGKDWEPGTEVNKDIQVDNTGDYDVITRVKFDESWTRNGKKFVTKDGLSNKAEQKNATDGLTTGDYSVVKKNLANSAKWFYNEDDGYWYYLSNVAAGENTGKFLDSVTLLEDTDMGKFDVVKYYTTAEAKPANSAIGKDAATQWVVYTGKVPAKATHTRTVSNTADKAAGYAGADYELTVTVQTVQATEAAVNSAFGLKTVKGANWVLN